MSNSKTKERDLDNMNENYCVYGIEFYDIDCSKPSHKEYLYTINDNKHRNTNNEITWMLGRWDGKKYKDNFVKAYNEGVHSYWKNNDDLRQWSVRLGMLTQEQVDRIRLGKKLTDAELLDIQRKVLNGELKNPAELPSNEYTGSIDAEGKNNSRILFNEGDINSITTNRYERNREAREQCIALKGCRCVVCGMDFKEKYGDIGEGFIHVHHITPISMQGKEYTLNVATDLVPVCPNCHAMLHRKNPPFTIDEMKEILNH